MSRYRLVPSLTQEATLREHCAHARFVWNLLVRRLEDKAPGRIQKVTSAYTSQRCSECGHVAAGNRKSQAVFACLACAVTLNADVNAARNIAAGHAVPARGRPGLPGRANREPHLPLLSA